MVESRKFKTWKRRRREATLLEIVLDACHTLELYAYTE